jgi:RNA polymerase sigma-70 factor, ECF subfamily
MFLNTKFHTSRIPNRAKAAEAAPAPTFSHAVHTNGTSFDALRTPHGARSNYIPGADAANDGERMLLTAIAGGDVSALTRIHSRYHRRLLCFARRITGRSDLAEEIANDTLWVIWQSAGQFRGASKVSTWILGIAFRLSMGTLRTMSRHWPRAIPLQGSFEDAHEPGAVTEVDEWVGVALALLPEEQRTVLELSYGLGFSCQEIAESAMCPVGTVKTRMYHGRRKLRQLLPRLAGHVSA